MASFSLSRMSFLKLLELLLTAICVGLHYHAFGGLGSDNLFVCTGTFVGYLIILVGVFGGYIMQAPISKRVDIFYSVAGCALFIASGVITIQIYQDSSSKEGHTGLAKGALAIINAGAFLVDAFLSFRNE